METLVFVLGIIICAVFLSLFVGVEYYKCRCDNVLVFRMIITDMCHDYNIRRFEDKTESRGDAFVWFGTKYSFEEMVKSFKPLKLEKWYTKDELEEINR